MRKAAARAGVWKPLICHSNVILANVLSRGDRISPGTDVSPLVRKDEW